MAFDDQEALSACLCLCLFDDMGALVTEHQIHEIPVARTFLLSLVALSATWLFLITLWVKLQVSGRLGRAREGRIHVRWHHDLDMAAQSWTGHDGLRLWDAGSCPKKRLTRICCARNQVSDLIM